MIARFLWVLVLVGMTPLCGGQSDFERGDCNSDATRNIADPIFLLGYLFTASDTPTCFDALDANDDGGTDIADAIYGLNYLFVPGSPPFPAPLDSCGADPTADSLDCVSSSCP